MALSTRPEWAGGGMSAAVAKTATTELKARFGNLSLAIWSLQSGDQAVAAITSAALTLEFCGPACAILAQPIWLPSETLRVSDQPCDRP